MSNNKRKSNEPQQRKSKKVKTEYQHIHIQNLDELISFSDKLKLTDVNKYNFDVQTLYYLNPSLKKLNKMIGMESVKKNIVNQILFHLQGLDNSNQHMMHTVIYGPPGVGKTELGKILGDIYCELNVLQHNKYSFNVIKRSDLVGRYLGETSIKTQEVIDKCKGGVMFIDEVYSLGSADNRDSFAKECIDVLNQNLSEGKSDFICIIAGYKDSVNKYFFAQNAGLERRFPYRYTINNYNANELKRIFLDLVNKCDWNILDNEQISDDFFETNKNYFKYNGGDLENYLEQVKISHSKRVFGLHQSKKKYLTKDDLEQGLETYKINNTQKDKIELNEIPYQMYS
jgi:SpoVK/Ycf46/Vps4 family AAA+-type ATPase